MTPDLGPQTAGTPTSPPSRYFSDSGAWHALESLPGPYLPWSAGAMRPQGLVTLLNDVVFGGRRRIVELGGGVSTILLGRLLAQQAGPHDALIVTVEHDPAWASWLTERLQHEGTDKAVRVVLAPLVEQPDLDTGLLWYDATALLAGVRDAFAGEAVDLLLVDGPPAYRPGEGLARYPALPALRGLLAPGATVILDDVERAGEQEILLRWQSETDLAFDPDLEHTGIAVARVPQPRG